MPNAHAQQGLIDGEGRRAGEHPDGGPGQQNAGQEEGAVGAGVGEPGHQQRGGHADHVLQELGACRLVPVLLEALRQHRQIGHRDGAASHLVTQENHAKHQTHAKCMRLSIIHPLRAIRFRDFDEPGVFNIRLSILILGLPIAGGFFPENQNQCCNPDHEQHDGAQKGQIQAVQRDVQDHPWGCPFNGCGCKPIPDLRAQQPHHL
mmetsp:Transcript_38352/g.63701  ORF Transcript_38352/g.63701 Transcript_38352/m.63701 type:complete len:205 (-) Transcript_38352:660-1274(-)